MHWHVRFINFHLKFSSILLCCFDVLNTELLTAILRQWHDSCSRFFCPIGLYRMIFLFFCCFFGFVWGLFHKGKKLMHVHLLCYQISNGIAFQLSIICVYSSEYPEKKTGIYFDADKYGSSSVKSVNIKIYSIFRRFIHDDDIRNSILLCCNLFFSTEKSHLHLCFSFYFCNSFVEVAKVKCDAEKK